MSWRASHGIIEKINDYPPTVFRFIPPLYGRTQWLNTVGEGLCARPVTSTYAVTLQYSGGYMDFPLHRHIALLETFFEKSS